MEPISPTLSFEPNPPPMNSVITRTFARGKAERGGKIIAHTNRILGGDVDSEALRAPIGHDGVRFKAAMRLHLGAKFAFNDDVCFSKPFATSPRGPPKKVLVVGPNTFAGLSDACCSRRCAVGWENLWRIGLARLVHIDDKRQGLVIHLDQTNGLIGGASRGGRNRGNAGADIAHGRQCARRADTGGARRCRIHFGYNVDSPHIGVTLGGAVSTERTRACGCGERRIRANSMPGSLTSTV